MEGGLERGGIRVCDCQLRERDPLGEGIKKRKKQKSEKGEQVSKEMVGGGEEKIVVLM